MDNQVLARHLAAPVQRATTRISALAARQPAASAGAAAFSELEEAFFRAGDAGEWLDPASHDACDLAPAPRPRFWRSVIGWLRQRGGKSRLAI